MCTGSWGRHLCYVWEDVFQQRPSEAGGGSTKVSESLLLSEETSGRQAPEEVNSLIWTKLFKVRHTFRQGQPLL